MKHCLSIFFLLIGMGMLSMGVGLYLSFGNEVAMLLSSITGGILVVVAIVHEVNHHYGSHTL